MLPDVERAHAELRKGGYHGKPIVIFVDVCDPVFPVKGLRKPMQTFRDAMEEQILAVLRVCSGNVWRCATSRYLAITRLRSVRLCFQWRPVRLVDDVVRNVRGGFMRPSVLVVLGAYADRHGRRAGLLLTLSLMSVGIVSIACTLRVTRPLVYSRH